MTNFGPESPLTPEEYERLVYYRKARIRTTGTPDEGSFIELCRRYAEQFPLTPERVGWHEAGHAIVSHSLGYAVWKIERHPDGSGHSLTDQQPILSDDWALITVAGYLAEDRAVGHADPAEAWGVTEVAERIYGLGPDERKVYVEEVEQCCSMILDENWGVVEQVAKLVESKTKVKMYELDRILAAVKSGRMTDSIGPVSSQLRRLEIRT